MRNVTVTESKQMGDLSAADSRHEETLCHFHRARQFLSQDARIPFQAAKSLAQLGRFEEAIQQAREAVRLDQNYWEARVFLGDQLAAAGRLAEAQTELEAALKLRPENAQTHLSLSLTMMRQNQIPEVIRHFEEALRFDRSSQPAKQHLEQLKSQALTEP